jgi:hypothetical protein
MTADRNDRTDPFAHVAAQRETENAAWLVEPAPPRLPGKYLPASGSDPLAAFRPAAKIDTAEKLRRELARYRRRFAKFMQDLAPAIEARRVVLALTDFDWRPETEEDRQDFVGTLSGSGQWERVRIPHYGGPLGRAVAYYRASFELTPEMLGRGAMFVCFKGVDYKAHIFVNGAYLGSHEGFFAPFEFEFTRVARPGTNVLLVRVENDAICMGNDSWGDDGHLYDGDKVYAATGPGYDDPQIGWHHCPPGMGIYQDVFIEARSPIHVHDVFVRPIADEDRAEAWIEIYNCGLLRRDVSIELSVFGQNFRKTVFRDRKYELPGPVGPTINYFRLPFDLPRARRWDLDTPWLYRVQVKVLDKDGKVLDAAKRSFGMRSFHMDVEGRPRGRLFLNGRQIRLRGANTMGFEQQCVMKKDWDRLRDDILLAKICHMNYWRLTQRPVQSEVYDFCDRLGLMTQTDLPLFGVLRRNQFCEAVRQAGEMERLVRAHPCNIMVSYINEPFPNAWGKGHRHLTRPELEAFFRAAGEAVRLANPDRVIKPVDGDYDPPAPGLPDNHCYCGWYNGHGLDLGRLHKGYWQKVKPGWLYGCGEFGSEGLDPVNTMRKYYPKDWLPQTPEEEDGWSPNRIVKAQTGQYHYMWFETQHTLAGWVRASQAHQAWVTRLMTEAFRRDSRMTSMAIHLFIDAFPSGWMKAIMDVDRQPKPAYFAYREALTPLMANIRTDRFAYFSGQDMLFEFWVCNDTHEAPRNARLRYQLEIGRKVVFAQQAKATIDGCRSTFQGSLKLRAPEMRRRTTATLRLALTLPAGKVLHDTAVEVELFPSAARHADRRLVIVGSRKGKADRLARELGIRPISGGTILPTDTVLIDGMAALARRRREIDAAVARGALAVILELPPGDHDVAGTSVKVEKCGMGDWHFVSRDSGHPLVAGFRPNDFRFWYDPDKGHPSPLLTSVLRADGWRPILLTGNGGWAGQWTPALAAAELPRGAGSYRVFQLLLAGRLQANPVAMLFARRLVT